MKTDIKTLQDTFESWYSVNEKSRKEASIVLAMYNNHQWDMQQLQELINRGQPTETFNIIKLMTRTLIGYYSSVVNKAVIEPRSYDNITKSTILNDALQVVYERNNFDIIDDDIKMYGILTGLLVSYTTVKASGRQDMFGQNEYNIGVEDINPEEIVIDPTSRKRDYSDARGIHRFRWVSEDELKQEFGKNKKTIEKLDAYANNLSIDEAEYTYRSDNEFIGKYKVADMYLLVHSVIGKESIFWCGDVEISRTKLQFEEVDSPYTVTKISKSNKEEYYGVFREVVESQKAINQALIQIQLLVNSNKVIVETDSVEDIDEFADAVARVNSVIEVNNLKGVLIQNMSQDVVQQYTIIDKGFDRIKQVLGVNDAMLGQSMAADSGRKLKLQKNSGLMTLRYLTAPIEVFHRTLAVQLSRLIVQFFTANQMLRVTDDVTGNRYIEINKPLLLPKLPPELQQLVAQGMPIEYAFEAMMTGTINPMVQQALQQDQQLQQANAEHQQMEQQAAQQQNQMQMQMVNNKMSGQAPMPNIPPPPPPANAVATMPTIDANETLEKSPQAQMNKAMSIKRPDAPPGLSFVYDEMINPVTGEPERDKDGNIYLVPVMEEGSKLDIKEFDVIISASTHDDEDEKAQLMLEVMLNGPAGQFAMNASPAHYAKMVSLNVQSMKTKHSPEIAQMFNEIAMSLGQNPQFEAYMRTVSAGIDPTANQGGQAMGDDGNGGMLPPGVQGGGPASSELKLPQNTNEGY